MPIIFQRRQTAAHFMGWKFFWFEVPGVSLAKPRFTPGFTLAPAPQAKNTLCFTPAPQAKNHV